MRRQNTPTCSVGSTLATALLAVGRPDEGEELLEAALGGGDRAAGLLLLMRYRKAERIEDCLRVASLLPADFRCATEKAKLYEWSIGDLAWMRSFPLGGDLRRVERGRDLARDDRHRAVQSRRN